MSSDFNSHASSSSQIDNSSSVPASLANSDGSTHPFIPLSIVSESRLLREGLPTLLQPHLTLNVIATYPSEPIPPDRVENPVGHVVLIDSGLGETLSTHWIRYWRTRSHPPSVLTLELTDDVPTILACIEAGACGYTLKSASPQEIADAIQLAHRGGAKCSPQVTRQLFARLEALKTMKIEAEIDEMPLTARELQVLRFIAKGYSNREIALALVVTLRTVKYHVHNILQKLEQDNRRNAVHVAVRQGWLESHYLTSPILD